MKLEDKLTKFREMGLKAEIKNGEKIIDSARCI